MNEPRYRSVIVTTSRRENECGVAFYQITRLSFGASGSAGD